MVSLIGTLQSNNWSTFTIPWQRAHTSKGPQTNKKNLIPFWNCAAAAAARIRAVKNKTLSIPIGKLCVVAHRQDVCDRFRVETRFCFSTYSKSKKNDVLRHHLGYLLAYGHHDASHRSDVVVSILWSINRSRDGLLSRNVQLAHHLI